ncbi:MAG TPA: hydrogenase maturation protease [Anaerolineales bacterium]|nr:hydrogenase maturation protease [Anaerolineales bacterium]
MKNGARTLIIGLGNPLLRDDGVGLHIVAALRDRVLPEGTECAEDTHGGLRLMERMIGFDRVVVVDALLSGAEPGTIQQLPLDGRPTRHSASTHDVDLPTALDVGRRSGAKLPPNDAVQLIGIEAEDVETFGETMTPAVAAAIPRAVEAVLAALARNREAT